MMSLPENLPVPEESADTLLKEKIVNTRVSENEYQRLETRALAAGKRLSTWMRDVLLAEIEKANVNDLILAELLGVRMIVLNVLGPLVRGEKINAEEFQKLVARIDELKVARAQELAERLAVSNSAAKGA